MACLCWWWPACSAWPLRRFSSTSMSSCGVPILMGIAIAVSGYVVLEFVLSADEREKEWLKRVGTPARLDLYQEGMAAAASIVEAVKAMSPGSDITIMFYSGSEGGKESLLAKEGHAIREKLFSSILERLNRGTMREISELYALTTTSSLTIMN